MRLGALWAIVFVVGCKDAARAPARCEPARIALDGTPMSFDHGALGYRRGDDWTIALFASTEAPDGIRHPADPTCSELLDATTADRVAVTAIDGVPRGGLGEYSLDTLRATGVSTYVPGTRCRDGEPCNKIEAALVGRPAADGAAMAICASATVHLTDGEGRDHELTIEGRVEGTYCGVKR